MGDVSAVERLLHLARSAKDRITSADGQWRLDAAREAVKLIPVRVGEKQDFVYRVQHAIRELLMAGGDAPPGVRVYVGRALKEAGAALALAMDGEGITTLAEADADAPRRYWVDP